MILKASLFPLSFLFSTPTTNPKEFHRDGSTCRYVLRALNCRVFFFSFFGFSFLISHLHD